MRTRFACFALLALCASSFAEQLLESGSFEWPPVTRRKPRSEGADVSKSAMNAEWITFTDKADAEGGRLILGLTNEISRTGRQCMYVEFNKLTKTLVSTQLSSDFIPVFPGKPYRVFIWGRVAKKEPVALDQRLPYLKLRIDWFMADKEEQTGEVVWKVQPIPGSKLRKPVFTAAQWSEYFANVKSPDDAAFIKVTWFWDTPPQEGETNGVIFFDDAGITGEAPPKEEVVFDEELKDDEKPAAEKPAEPAKPDDKAKPPVKEENAAKKTPAAPKQ